MRNVSACGAKASRSNGRLCEALLADEDPGQNPDHQDRPHRSARLTTVAEYHIIYDMIKVVLDTNVLVAAARSREGASFVVLRALRHGGFVALASVPLLLEYEAVLKRPEHLQPGNRTLAQVDAFLDAFCLHVEAVHLHYLWRPQTRDTADEMVLETALNGQADALVTLNTADFAQAARRFSLRLLTPAEFLRRHLSSVPKEK